jgi:outer membrane usher protein
MLATSTRRSGRTGANAAGASVARLAAVSLLLLSFASFAKVSGPPPNLAALVNATSTDPMVLAVTLNGEPRPDVVYFLSDPTAGLMIDEKSLIRWNVVYPADRRRVDDDRAYIPVDAVAGMTVEINVAKQAAAIVLPPQSFHKETVPFEMQGQLPPVVPGWGGFFNYNLFAQHTQSTTTTSGLLEPGIFGPYGVGTVLVGVNGATALGTTQRVVRLDASWRMDNPEHLTTLIIGDSITRVGSWGQAVRFGGLQYGTNFSLQPNFISYPLQAVAGLATLPSTVDIFINNAKVGEQQVQPGPFSITNIPIVSGAGNVQLVVRDAFGREQVVSQPFYATQALLRQGLSDYDVEGGTLRRNYGIVSDDYAGSFASGLYRYGFTDRFTGEARGETSSRLVAGGLHGDYQVGDFGVVSAGVVLSHSDAGSGTKLLAGIQRQSSPFAFSINGEWNTSGFREVGTLDQPLQLIRQGAVSASIDVAPAGSFSFAVAAQQYRGARSTEVGTATYSVQLGAVAFLNLSVTRTVAISNQTGIFATVTIPFGGNTFATLGAQRTHSHGSDAQFGTVGLQRNLPQGEGYGYQLFAASDRRYQATGTINGPVGSYSLGVAQADSVTAVQANITGGVGLVGGQPFASRQLIGSFGVARVDDIEGVDVYAQNQLIGKTNSAGFAVLPELSAYDQNQISIDPLTVPMNATIDNTRIVVVPYVRSGVLVNFKVRREFGGTMTINLEDGKPAPEGSIVTLISEQTTFPVGFNGEAYVVGLHEGENNIRMRWRGSSCEFKVRTSTSADPVPDLGTFMCTGVKR